MESQLDYRPLYEPALYRGEDGLWYKLFTDAVAHSDSHLTWDTAGILSLIALSYPCAERTLIQEIPRQPWMSSAGPGGERRLHPIPPHDTIIRSYDTIVSDFVSRTQAEIVAACKGRKKVYLTLTGGMDSRVVAMITCRARDAGLINADISAVTWGVPNSRDAVYAEKVARILGLDWMLLDYTAEHLYRNVELVATRMACMSVSGMHLHRLEWFQNQPKDTLVIASNYGDAIGRGEFSGKIILELELLHPTDTYALLKANVLPGACRALCADLEAFRARTPGAPYFALCENEMCGHYIRGFDEHVYGLLTSTDYYHVFTAPEVYTYMWSLHPRLRTNDVYAGVLERYSPPLARLPWARTGRAIRGRTEGTVPGLQASTHNCYDWVAGTLYDRLLGDLDLDWYRSGEIFNAHSIRKLAEGIRGGTRDADAYDRFLWLVSFRRFARMLEQMGKTPRLKIEAGRQQSRPVEQKPTPSLKRWLRNTPLYSAIVQPARIKARRWWLRHQAFKNYPPKYVE